MGEVMSIKKVKHDFLSQTLQLAKREKGSAIRVIVGTRGHRNQETSTHISQ